MRFTCQSETGKLKSLYLKKVEDAFIDEQCIGKDWKGLRFLAKPDLRKAISEYELFESLLKTTEVEIKYFPRDETVNMDSIYCRDASISTDAGMIICNMGKKGRIHEPAAANKIFESNGNKILGGILSPGTLEGGDVAWLDEKTLAVGHSYRSNAEGISQLKSLLKPLKVEVIVVDLPHYKGSSDVFHLMSVLSPADKTTAVVYSPLLPISFRKFLLDRNYTLIEVPDSEFESMGCNVLALGPGKCLMLEGNPLTRAAIEKAGCSVLVYSGNEISMKGGGGPTCLTRPVSRWAE